MEVHHKHAEHSGKRRFLVELVMISIAVFIGSMGEYYVEHRIMQERRDEGLQLVLRNLETDRRNIEDILGFSDRGLAFLARTKISAYRHRSGAIDREQYFRTLTDDLPNIYQYRTLFMDSAAFNSMSAAGLVSLIESTELKARLSNYYEVMGQRLEDNNKLVDEAARSYYAESFPLYNTTDAYRVRSDLDLTVPAGMRIDNKTDVAFYLTLPLVRERLTADSFITDTDNLFQRVANYRALLLSLRDENRQLDAALRKTAQ